MQFCDFESLGYRPELWSWSKDNDFYILQTIRGKDKGKHGYIGMLWNRNSSCGFASFGLEQLFKQNKVFLSIF